MESKQKLYFAWYKIHTFWLLELEGSLKSVRRIKIVSSKSNRLNLDSLPGLIKSIIRLECYSKEVAVGFDAVRQFSATVPRNFSVHSFIVAELNVVTCCVRCTSFFDEKRLIRLKLHKRIRKLLNTHGKIPSTLKSENEINTRSLVSP